MPLRTMAFLLKHAKENHYGVAAFNVWNLESIQAAVSLAEEEDSSVILALGAGVLQYGSGQTVADIATGMAARSTVPIAVHLDHGPSYQWAMTAIRYGFTSVMIDNSTKPWEENVRLTKEVVQAGHACGVTVEAEIGHVGYGTEELTDDLRANLLTKPEDAARFVEETGVDALAVAIGNLHGVYSFTPKLEFDRLEAIVKATPAYIVMHGGTQTPGLDRAVRIGCTKVNVGTDIGIAFRESVQKTLESNDIKTLNGQKILAPTRDAMKEMMRSYVKQFQSSGHAHEMPTHE